jgi:DNA-binding SARP family transcriptional activator
VVAGAGYGKTTLLGQWAATTPRAMSVWHTLTSGDRTLTVLVRAVTQALRLCVPGLPADLVAAVSGPRGPDTGTDEAGRAQAYAGRISEALAEHQQRELVLVLDDGEVLDGASESAAFVAGLCRQAPHLLHVVLSSRREPPFPLARLRGQGQVFDLSAADLAFTPEETAAVVRATVGRGDGDAGVAALDALAAELYEITAGWPAAVRLTCEALARAGASSRHRATLDRLRRPGGELFDYLAEEVVAAEPDEGRALLTRLAALDRFTPELAGALGGERSDLALAGLVRRGVVADAPLRGEAWLSVNALVREVVAASPAAATARRATLLEAARWWEGHGQPAEALRCTLAAEDGEQARRLVGRWGPQLLQAGEVGAVVDAVSRIDPGDRSPALHRIAGDALQLIGDWDGAVASYEQAAGDDDVLPPGLAWRLGLIHHLRGDLATALAVYARGDHDDGTDPADRALLQAWTATAHWLRGDAETCRRLAADAMVSARRSEDDRALAAAHTVQALVAAHDGDRLANDTHYLRALDHAEAAGDLLQVIRIRLNRGSRLNEEGFYDEAIVELDLAVGHADLGGYAAFKAIALGNRGEARYHLGQFDHALDDLEAAKAIFQRLGSLLVAYPLAQAGHIHAARGQTALARAAFAEAVTVSRRSGDIQGLAPGLAGLARLLADDDPVAARAAADEAVATAGDGLGQVEALLAQGWAALACGDRDEAGTIGERAATFADERRDRAGLADATELIAAAGAADRAPARLRAALALWEELCDPLGQGRVLLALARLGGPDARTRAREAERVLRPLGAGRLAAEATRLASATPPPPELAIHCLGGFAVQRAGSPVPLGDWQSRKARDLVKVLIAHEGRPVHRGVLRELLWPDDDPDATASRLSVALSTARAVLDPAKAHPAGWYVAADADTVWLDVDHVEVDVLRFADLAARAAIERKPGPSAAALDALDEAEVAYVGDAFPEDPYEDWTVSPRERARAGYIWVARTLADDSLAAGDTATAVRCYLRVLAHDPYDEHAHLGLVGAQLAAGQLGEARRAYQAYCVRMDDIGVEAAPFPAAPDPART